MSEIESLYSMKVIAHIHTDFPAKFGIPRQSGIIDTLESSIIFTPEYRNPDAVRGLDGFSYIWLLWQFSETAGKMWSPMVRPPRLGGSKKMGVFATRSPFRPNSIGLSSVRLSRIEYTGSKGPVIYVLGADIMDNTPVYDIKPYLSYTDSHPDAVCGFTDTHAYQKLTVQFTAETGSMFSGNKKQSLIQILENDPRPHYQNDPDRIYGFEYSACNIQFKVSGTVLSVLRIEHM